MKTLSTRALGLAWWRRLLRPLPWQALLMRLPFDDIRQGSLTLSLGEQTWRFESGQAGYHAELVIVRPLRTYWLLKTRGELGFAQAYYEGALETPSLYQLMHLAYDNRHLFESLLGGRWLTFLERWQHRRRHNSVSNSRRNIAFHYDLGNAFYRLWLDPSMTYSSALFSDTHTDLGSAQRAKYQRILAQLQLKGGERLLEIGCGWGGFMELALQQQAEIKGLTLSVEQKSYAQQRLQQSADAARFEVALQDYRHETGSYDHIVSIEMFEAVGKEYWQVYFEQIQRLLKPGGKAVLQVITIDEAHAQRYQNSVDFIQTYIFPGGLLPSLTQLRELGHNAGLQMTDSFAFGQDYARTCQLWKHRFNQEHEQLERLGYDRAFQRLWNYYLDYCSVGFETGHINVHQVTFEAPAHDTL
ncbi:SAM-dependent methyltransferase [Thiomicrorhabdus cannonii]|uniref:SAM-dependent methyltransferase n=1 Tax=Thiomicrorhabdus cannonii TaxID=2748011 RepID=UPI0015BEEA5C|nr:cyclopropane-fatty-acyl-phospholipid synthase family protein [Thiomicrorhabdus cannonii]